MRTLSCGMHVGSSSLTRDRTQAPCIGSVESYPLHHQGRPKKEFLEAAASQLEERGKMAEANGGEENLKMKLMKLFSGWGYRQAPTGTYATAVYENKRVFFKAHY